MEVYKIIEDYPKYRVSNYGNVQSIQKGEWINLKPGFSKKGYASVSLFNKGVKPNKNFRINRLVAKYFLDEPLEGETIVRHMDNNPSNNHFENLKWGTYKDNEEDKKLHGTWNTRMTSAKLSFDIADEIRIKFKEGQSQLSLAKEYNVSRTSITRIINYTTWKTRQYE